MNKSTFSSFRSSKTAAHLAALFTILVWGTTFVSTKILLRDFPPVVILVLRFVIGYLALFLMDPHRLKCENRRQELTFAAAGLCGICLYYLLENIALTFTAASNVGVLISAAPFFTALFSHWLLHERRPGPLFFAGFALAMVGIVLISAGDSSLSFNPLGDLLALLAAIVWALYSILTRQISRYGYGNIAATRHTFFYGLLFMIPALFLLPHQADFSRLSRPEILFNLLYLGLGASALCFLTWNFSVRTLGPVRTSVYIYLVPVITLIASAIVLHESMSWIALTGTALVLCGLALSEWRKPEQSLRKPAPEKKEKKERNTKQ